jgi:hypothetical protein
MDQSESRLCTYHVCRKFSTRTIHNTRQYSALRPTLVLTRGMQVIINISLGVEERAHKVYTGSNQSDNLLAV